MAQVDTFNLIEVTLEYVPSASDSFAEFILSLTNIRSLNDTYGVMDFRTYHDDNRVTVYVYKEPYRFFKNWLGGYEYEILSEYVYRAVNFMEHDGEVGALDFDVLYLGESLIERIAASPVEILYEKEGMVPDK